MCTIEEDNIIPPVATGVYQYLVCYYYVENEETGEEQRSVVSSLPWVTIRLIRQFEAQLMDEEGYTSVSVIFFDPLIPIVTIR